MALDPLGAVVLQSIMALSGRLALAALRLWGPGGLGPHRSSKLKGPGCNEEETETKGQACRRENRDCWKTDSGERSTTDVLTVALQQQEAAYVTGGRRPISLCVGASGGFGGGGSSEKKLSLQDVAELLRTRACSRVVVMVGAGISTPSGIPDFRSPGSGLYSNLQQYDIPYPEAIFELGFFFHNPKPFFMLAKELYPGHYRPNVTHYFLRLLHDKELLLRLYTQNIDGLERASGIPASKLVEAHGTFVTATCTVCRRSFSGEDIWADVMADRVPRCPVCTGVVKPDIVFFGEQLPARFLLHMADFALADLLLILGTSLEW